MRVLCQSYAEDRATQVSLALQCGIPSSSRPVQGASAMRGFASVVLPTRVRVAHVRVLSSSQDCSDHALTLWFPPRCDTRALRPRPLPGTRTTPSPVNSWRWTERTAVPTVAAEGEGLGATLGPSSPVSTLNSTPRRDVTRSTLRVESRTRCGCLNSAARPGPRSGQGSRYVGWCVRMCLFARGRCRTTLFVRSEPTVELLPSCVQVERIRAVEIEQLKAAERKR